MRVDLPEPDKPMTTNVSPLPTSKETSRTPTVQPVACCTSSRDAPLPAISIALSGLAPKTFQMCSTDRHTSPVTAPS